MNNTVLIVINGIASVIGANLGAAIWNYIAQVSREKLSGKSGAQVNESIQRMEERLQHKKSEQQLISAVVTARRYDLQQLLQKPETFQVSEIHPLPRISAIDIERLYTPQGDNVPVILEDGAHQRVIILLPKSALRHVMVRAAFNPQAVECFEQPYYDPHFIVDQEDSRACRNLQPADRVIYKGLYGDYLHLRETMHRPHPRKSFAEVVLKLQGETLETIRRTGARDVYFVVRPRMRYNEIAQIRFIPTPLY